MGVLNNRVTKIELGKCEGLIRDPGGSKTAGKRAGSRGRRHCGEGQRGRCVRFRRRAAARRIDRSLRALPQPPELRLSASKWLSVFATQRFTSHPL